MRRSLALLLLTSAPAMAAEPLPPERASAFARLALKNLAQEYPHKPGFTLGGPAEVVAPRAAHPAFYGSYDWHSSVHGHWLLVRLLVVAPSVPEAGEIRAMLDRHLTPANLAAEQRLFQRPENKSFERPYGWAWLFKLAEELRRADGPDFRRWEKAVAPFAEFLARRFAGYFPKQTYPIRTGVHPNTAFGLAFAHDYAVAVGDAKLRELAEERAKAYFAADADYPAAWEPGGADFFSPALMEADLMRRVLPPERFAAWFDRFLPGAARSEPKSLFAPAAVTDRADPQLVHLDGLNLSRAWNLRCVAAALPAGHAARPALRASAARHAEAGLAHVASGDYAGEHWLASFAVYLLTATPGG